MKLEPAKLPESRPQPHSLSDLFFSFTVLALQGFGGVLAIVQRELVEKKKWLTKEEFIEEWAIAQIMPGANIVNFSMMIGDRYFGLPGALAALAGMLAAPLMLIMLLALVYVHFAHDPSVAGALRGMGAVAAGLMIASGLKLCSALAHHPLGRILCAAFVVLCFIAVALLHWPLAYVLFGPGIVACALTYSRLRS